MSYCVNCGVELEESLAFCPLCNTPVINLNNIQKQRFAVSPFAQEKGAVETVHSSDWAILLSTVLASTAAACGLLNFLVFNGSRWSIPVIGLCILLWVYAIPFFIYTKLPMYVAFLFDGFITGIYLYMITYITQTDTWFMGIGIPIVILVTILVEVFWGLYKNISSSFLATALYFFIGIGLLCSGIEIILDLYLDGAISLYWSTIPATACVIICIVLAVVLSRKRLRNSLRRRLHF